MKQSMKRIIALGLTLSLFILQGCGGPAGESEGTEESSSATVSVEGLSFTIYNAVSNLPATSIPTTDTARVEISLFSAADSSVNKLISASTTVGTLSQSQVLTDSLGKASFSVLPPSLVSGTAPGTITIVSETGETAALNFEFVATAVNVETPASGSLQFVSASPEILSLKGTGGVGFGETSQVVFKVVDINGNPIEGTSVDFSLSSYVGGLYLSRESTTSDVNGLVSTTVNSGTIATPIRVLAEITLESGEKIAIQSDLLTVTTGIPDQNSFSISTDTFAPEAWRTDGVTSTITVRLGDRFNNPVPDGTVINFTAEGGLIDSTCQTSNSVCSVTWSSQEPRPQDHRVTILAHAIGHESYYDKNGSGVFDDGDAFDDLPEAYRDDDENAVFDPNASGVISQDEKYIDYDLSGNYTDIDGVFNGVPCLHSTLCPENANNVGGRSNTLTTVRGQITLIMADRFPNVYLREIDLALGFSCLDDSGKFKEDGTCSTDPVLLDQEKTLWVMIEDSAPQCLDVNGNSVFVNSNDYSSCASIVRSSAPTGSGISLDTDAGELSDLPFTTIDNTTGYLEFLVSLQPSLENDEAETGVVTLKVTTPTGESSARLGVTDPANVVAP